MFNELAGWLRMTALIAARKEVIIQVSNYAIMSTSTIRQYDLLYVLGSSVLSGG
jgi:hypothetical protein